MGGSDWLSESSDLILASLSDSYSDSDISLYMLVGPLLILSCTSY